MYSNRARRRSDRTFQLKRPGAQSALEQVISAQRAKLTSAYAVQKCLYEVLLYADGDDAVMYAEVTHVVAALVEHVLDDLDPLHLRRVVEEGNFM